MSRFLGALRAAAVLTAAICVAPAPATAQGHSRTDLTEVGLEELMNIEVISVSKREQKLARTPAAAVITMSVARPAAQHPSRLEFNRYGNSYFLTKVWDAFSDGGKAPLKTPQQKEYAARNGLVQTASVPAQRR